MLESTRLDYLAAMGVMGWVPREALLHAPLRMPPELPEPELVVMHEEPVPVTVSAPSAVLPLRAGRSAAVRAKIVVRSGASEPVPRADTGPAPVPPEARLPPLEPFYLQLWLAGSCALLIETPEPGLESASPALRLLKDILRAVGLPEAPRMHSDFRWPLNRNPQLDRSAPAASLALQAFMHGRLEDSSVVSIGCFGRQTRLLLGHEQTEQQVSVGQEQTLDGLPPAWFAPDLESLMRNGASKAQLWQQLRRNKSRWQVSDD